MFFKDYLNLSERPADHMCAWLSSGISSHLTQSHVLDVTAGARLLFHNLCVKPLQTSQTEKGFLS